MESRENAGDKRQSDAPMNYAEIKYCDIANGPGVRTSLFVSGCRHHCEGCFNEVAWDFDFGKPFDKEIAENIYKSCEPSYIAGLSVLGGEPFEPENQKILVKFTTEFKNLFPNKTIWCYSGCRYEEILSGTNYATANAKALLENIDVLVDGKFKLGKKDIGLRFKGSSNQRIIDLNKTRKTGILTIWHDDPIFETHSMK